MHFARTTVWRQFKTYLWVGAGILAGVAIALLWMFKQYFLIFLFTIVLLQIGAILWLRRRASMQVHDRELRQGVAAAIGQEVGTPFTRAATVAELREGQGGWAQLASLGLVEGTYFVGLGDTLTSTPRGPSPALIVRADENRLHLFRFGDALERLMPYRVDETTASLIDHGRVGPAQFALVEA